MLPFTQKQLMNWADPSTLRDGTTLFEKGLVLSADFEDPKIFGEVAWANRSIRTSARVYKDGSCESLCPCRDSSERGIICAHVIALGLTLIRKYTDPDREQKQVEEQRKSRRIMQKSEDEFLYRVNSKAREAIPAALKIVLSPDWKKEVENNQVHIRIFVEAQDRIIPISDIPNKLPLAFSSEDDAILFVLEDIAEGRPPCDMSLNINDFINLIELHTGRELLIGNKEQCVVNAAKMQTILRLDMDYENGELLLFAHTELPFLKAGEFPFYIASNRSGWVYASGHLWPLEQVLPEPLRHVYRDTVAIPRHAAIRFLQHEIPMLSDLMPIETDISIDLFTIEPERPRFELDVKGSPASLSAQLYAVYGDSRVLAAKSDPAGHFSHPDPEDLFRYTIRHMDSETAGLNRLARFQFVGDTGDELSPIVGCREVLNFLGTGLPALRRMGWQVHLEGRVEPFMEDTSFVTPVVEVQKNNGSNWFEVSFNYEDQNGNSISSADIQRALRKGESYIEHGKQTILIDKTAIESMLDVFSDCSTGEGSKPGSFKMADVYASYIQSSLNALDGIDIEADSAWQQNAALQNRNQAVENVVLPSELSHILRDYQKDGVHWLRFLEQHAFGGILADEMGLGKTLQTLTWLQLKRCHDATEESPALIVCPTSLVENWAEEAEKFVPNMKTLMLTGTDRHANWSRIHEYDILITSYALIRRDIERYKDYQFSIAVLDEAQHIKNRSTQNALAAKKIKAWHRLVLTGTPIENSVSDLWSIMDFVMPDYLGSHQLFKQNYEQPIGQGGAEGEIAQTKLKRKLNPFLLRRLKKDVAKDLPPKIERVAYCHLTADQKKVYETYIENSRQKIVDMVEKKGFQRSRMEILKTLLRLRQTSCHLDLLKLKDLDSKYPSGKMDLFLELLNEAMDAGHRVLVFSQFVTMLQILRKELEEKQVGLCYLDGSTKERLKIVHEFNTNRNIPVFLISLKAGGTGLNLTGADMVIHFDPWWNPAVENQATDRAYRIGQKRTVYSVKLITRDTVEEKVLAMQRKKKAVIDATLESDEQIMSTMTWDDVRELLAI